jgi:hypothetical protein
MDSDWVDIGANFLFYLPLGFLAAATRRTQNVAGVIAVTLMGAMLSLAMELAQMYLPQRDSSYRDLACNTAGALAGSLLAFTTRRHWQSVQIPWPTPAACGLLLLWTGWQMYPFIPSLRRNKLHELAAQLPRWNFHAMEFGDIFLAAFLLFAFLSKAGQKRGVAACTAAVALGVALLGQSIISSVTYSNARLAAAAAGLILAILLWRPEQRSLWITLAVVLCGWLVFRELDPLYLLDPALKVTGIPVQTLGSHPRSPYFRTLAGTAFMCCAAAAALYRALRRAPVTLR